jgi:hypothetical protein
LGGEVGQLLEHLGGDVDDDDGLFISHRRQLKRGKMMKKAGRAAA